MRKKSLIIFVTAALFISGCSVSTKKEEVVENTSDTTTNTEEETNQNDENIIADMYSLDGSYELPFEETETYTIECSYHIPMITDDSSDAKKINDEIHDRFDSNIEHVKKLISGEANEEELYEADYGDVSYEYYENGNVVSIVILVQYTYSDYMEYMVYNYDKEKKVMVSNDEMINIAGLSKEKFLTCAKYSLGEKALKNATEYANEIDSSDEDEASIEYRNMMIPDFIKSYVDTISDSKNDISMPMYFDADNKLVVVGRVYVPAGAGVYPSETVLDKEITGNDTSVFDEFGNKYHYDGFEKNCMNLYDIEGLSATAEHTTEDGDTYTDNYYMGYKEGDPSVFLYQDVCSKGNEERCYEGEIKFIGIDENGIVYEYELNVLNGKQLDSENILKGKFSLYTYWEDFDFETGSTPFVGIYNHVEGYDLFDTGNKPFTLEKTYG